MKTKTIPLSVLILLVSTVLFTACGSPNYQLQVGSEANGSQHELDAGQMLVISLESNPSTGYSWHVAQIDEAVLKQVGEVEFAGASGDEQLVGAGGTETLRFEAVGSGTTTLTLTYDRAWEDVPAEATFTITVVVP